MSEIKVVSKPKHQWVAVATYRLTEEQAQASLDEDFSVPLTHEMLDGTVGPVCYNCEQAYGSHQETCPVKVLAN